MASHLIDDYLSALAGRLPADTVEELADGLIETNQHHLAHGLDPEHAARAAIAEFGAPDATREAVRAACQGRLDLEETDSRAALPR